MDNEKAIQEWNSQKKREALRSIRRATGASLSEVAAMAGLSQSMISKYELGQRDLSLEAIRSLRVAVNAICDTHERELRKRALIERAASKDMRELLGHAVPLWSLADPEGYRKKVEGRRAEMAREYGPHWQEVFEALFKYQDMEKRLAELQDVLGMKTKAAVLDAEAEEKIEKIQGTRSAGLEG
jgi:transcriptional regulator with XRE-family HTH domain